MSHALSKKADGTYRMAYRYRSDADKVWHEDSTKVLRWLTDPDLETVKTDLEANVPVELRAVKCAVTGYEIPEVKQTWRAHLDVAGNPVLDQLGNASGNRLGIVGPEYTIIQDHECVDWLKPWVDAKACSVETGGAILGGSRFWMLAKMTQDPVEVVKDDPVEQYVAIINGHDGKLAFRAFPTTIRIVCQNTMSMAMQSKLAKKFRAKHSRLVYMKANEIRDAVGAMQGILLDNVVKFKALAAVNVQSDAHLQAYFQQVIGEKVDTEKEVNKESLRPLGTLMRLFEEDTSTDATWWRAYNSLTNFVTHLRGRNSDARLDNMFTGIGAQMIERGLTLGLDAANGKLDLAA